MPEPRWPTDQFHAELMACLDDALLELQEMPNFEHDWRAGICAAGTRTAVRRAPLLGLGGGGREQGGLLTFAHMYVDGENLENADHRGFERYQDFALYTIGDWYLGEKRPLMVCEVESSPGELIGEITGLWAIRCPLKYLFISPFPDLFEQPTSYCATPANGIVDWARTTYFVIEIPDVPTLPSTRTTCRADVTVDRGIVAFRRV